MKQTHEIRYASESFGTVALYGRFTSEGAANAELRDFQRRAREHGANRVAQSAHVRLRGAR